jgi:hypothetical protein
MTEKGPAKQNAARISRPKTPQEKKVLSYQKDRRNTYGESVHGARKAIPQRKAWVNRSYRHTVRQQLAPAPIDLDHELDPVGRVRRKTWRKCADSRLGDVVHSKHTRREQMGINAQPAEPSVSQNEAKRRILQRRDREPRWAKW